MAGLTRVSPGKIETRIGLAPSGGRRESVLLPFPVSRSLGGGFPRGAAASRVSCPQSQAPVPLPTRPRPDPGRGTAAKPERTRLTTPGSGTWRSWGRGGSGPIGHRCRPHPQAPWAARALKPWRRRHGPGACAGHRETNARPRGGRRAPLHPRWRKWAPPTAGSGLPALPTRDWSGSRHVMAARPIRFSPRFHASVTGLVGTQEPHPGGAPEQPERRKEGNSVENSSDCEHPCRTRCILGTVLIVYPINSSFTNKQTEEQRIKKPANVTRAVGCSIQASKHDGQIPHDPADTGPSCVSGNVSTGLDNLALLPIVPVTPGGIDLFLLLSASVITPGCCVLK